MRFDDIVSIVECYFQRDDCEFNRVVRSIAEYEHSKGRKNNYRKIIEVLERNSTKEYNPSSGLVLYDYELDESAQITESEFYDVIYPKDISMHNLILSEMIDKKLKSILLEYENRDKFETKGIHVENKLLLCGPPGCGKTTIAYYIAKQLNLPIIYIRFDSLISSMLGQTSSNIREVFDLMEQKNVILFLDEFDSIARRRDDNNELGELKRVVNSLLQNIDQMSNNNFLIAASNHEESLDPAIWRRFNSILYLDKPNQVLRTKYISNLLTYYNFDMRDSDLEKASQYCKDFSYSQIKEILIKVIKKELLENKNKIDLDDFIESIVEATFMYNFNKNKINYEKVNELRKRGLTLKKLSELLGIPSSTLSDNLKKIDSKGK